MGHGETGDQINGKSDQKRAAHDHLDVANFCDAQDVENHKEHDRCNGNQGNVEGAGGDGREENRDRISEANRA